MIADRIVDWANIVRTRRMERGLTQAQLAEIAGLSRQWVSNFESGRRTEGAALRDLRKVLGALELTVTVTGDPE